MRTHIEENQKCNINTYYKKKLRLNLKNLSGGLNLSRGLVPLKIVSNVSRFKPSLNLKRIWRNLADLSRSSNSLNSASEEKKYLHEAFFGGQQTPGVEGAR